MAACAADGLRVGCDDRILAIVPMFHANAWGLVYAALMAGADLLMPDRFLQAEPLGPIHFALAEQGEEGNRGAAH